jgi:hypothetical protein
MRAKEYLEIRPHYDVFHDPAPSSLLLVPSRINISTVSRIAIIVIAKPPSYMLSMMMDVGSPRLHRG